MKRTFLFLCAAAWLVRPATSFAHADFVIQAHGEGFADTTPVQPVGGNRARTLGAQRLAAVKFAAGIWSKLLDSPVPIVVDVTFGDLECKQPLPLAGASPAGITGATLTDETGRRTQIAVPAALANRLKGEDLEPSEPDIKATINTQVDLGCRFGPAGWYLGFDGNAGEKEDLVDALLHELAHGLGFISLVDDESGDLVTATTSSGETISVLDIFTANIVDVASGRSWSDLTSAQRQRSLTTPRGAVWDGPNVRALASKYLTRGEPRVVFDPPVAGFSGLVGDGGAGTRLTADGLSAQLFMMPGGRQCTAPSEVAGRVVLVDSGPCKFMDLATALQQAGASAIILVTSSATGEAPLSLSEPDPGQWHLDIPFLTMANVDGALLHARGAGFPQRVRLFAETSRYAGADGQGRPYLYTNDPAEPGSTTSHFETLARPDLLMEPASRSKHTHDVDLTRALLADVGWEVTCGNGQLDPGEQCDEGNANSDAADARCHTTCKPPTCGDGIKAAGEACDEGMLNNDAEPGACGTTCQFVPCAGGAASRDGTCGDAPTASSKPGNGPFGRRSSDDDDDDEDDDEDVQEVKGGDDGCRLAPSASGQTGLGSALSCLGLLALVAVRRRRARG